MRSVLVLMSSLLAVGCGDDGEVGKLPDAFFESDAPVGPDAPVAPVKLTVVERGSPVADVPVYFQNADNSLVVATLTDANGVASAVMAAGGYVTAIDPFRLTRGGVASNSVYTYAAVEPGDDLQLVDGSAATLVTVNVTIPSTTAASGYLLHSSCARSAQSIAPPGGMLSFDACGEGDFLVEALDASGNTLSTLFSPNHVLVDQGTVDLTGGAYVPAMSRIFRYTGFDPSPTEVFTTPWAVSPRGILHEAFANIGFEGGTGERELSVPATSPGLATVVESRFSSVAFGQHTVLDWAPSSAGPWILDNTNLLLPTFTELTAFDLATATFSWTEGATGVIPDAALVRVDFGREGAMIWDWYVVAPHTGTSVKLPTLPGDAAVFNPLAGDAAFPDGLTTLKAPGGYDALRPVLLSRNLPEDAFVTAPTGRVVYQSYVAINAFTRLAHEAIRRGGAHRFTRTAR